MSSDFWSKKLGQPAGVPAPQTHATASPKPWWDQRAPIPAQPSYAPSAQVLYDANGNAVMVSPNGQVMAVQGTPGDLSPELIEHYTKSARKAKSNTDLCPGCTSPNYVTTATAFTHNGQVETKKCFDCGFPVVQQFSGTATTGGKVSGRTRQIEHGGIINNFAPVVATNGTQMIAPLPGFAAEYGLTSR